jgi:hypothetical protein
MTISTVPIGTSASPRPGGDHEVLAAAAGDPEDGAVERDADRDRDERSDQRQDGVGADEARGDLPRCQTDCLEHAVVADALAHGEQRDRHERRRGDHEQHRVEGVDEHRQLLTHVADLVRRPGIERGLHRQREHDRRRGDHDRTGEPERAVTPGEQVLEAERERQRQRRAADRSCEARA